MWHEICNTILSTGWQSCGPYKSGWPLWIGDDCTRAQIAAYCKPERLRTHGDPEASGHCVQSSIILRALEGAQPVFLSPFPPDMRRGRKASAPAMHCKDADIELSHKGKCLAGAYPPCDP